MKLLKTIDDYLKSRADILAMGIAVEFMTGVDEQLDEFELNERPINSPVEQIFWIEWQFRLATSRDRYFDFDSRFELLPQVNNELTGKFRLDFQVDFFAGIINSHDSKYWKREEEISEKVEMPLLGIEIDSHIWHEKTKEQARQDKERERFLVAKGWQLLRFTGSEIFNNVPKCIDETLQVAYGLSNKYKERIDNYLKGITGGS